MSNDIKAIATLGIVTLLILGMVIWSGAGSEIRPAVVNGMFTLLAAVGGAFVVFYQLRKQRENATASNLQIEKLKLKKQVYEELAEICRETTDAVSVVESYVARAIPEVRHARDLAELGLDYKAPAYRYEKVSELQLSLATQISRILRALSRWEVIDPRIRVFKFAMNITVYEVHAGVNEFRDKTSTILPFDDRGLQHAGWEVPNDQAFGALIKAAGGLSKSLDHVRYWVMDLQAEMQSELLGELFGNRVKPRISNPDTPRVLMLEKDEELVQYLLKETTWGKRFGPAVTIGPLTTR